MGCGASSPAAAHYDPDAAPVAAPKASSSLDPPPLSSAQLAQGTLMVLAKLSTLSGGQADAVVSALTALYTLWNSAATKAVWAADFMAALQLVERDIEAGRVASPAAFASYLQRMEAVLAAAHETLREVLSPSKAFVIDLVRLPYLQAQLALHLDQLNALRTEALAGTMVDAALDARQAGNIVQSLLNGDASSPTDVRSTVEPLAAASSNGAMVAGAVLLGAQSVPTSQSPEVAQLFALLSGARAAYGALQAALARRAEREKREAAGEGAQWAREQAEAAAKPEPWVSEFAGFLQVVEQELLQAHLLLDSPAAVASEVGQSKLSDLTAGLKQARVTFEDVLRRQTPSASSEGFVASLSSFLVRLAARSDRAALMEAKSSIDAAKAGLLAAVLTQMRSESKRLAGEQMDKLHEYVDAQERALQQLSVLRRRSAQEDVLRAALRPIEAAAELASEYQRFLPGTRVTVLRRFARWMDAPYMVDDGNVHQHPPPPPAFFLFSSPGHGKTTLVSLLCEQWAARRESGQQQSNARSAAASGSGAAASSSSSSPPPMRVAAVHLFKFDQNARRLVGRALRSVAWQLAQNVPGFEHALQKALAAHGVDFDAMDSSNSQGQDKPKDGAAASEAKQNDTDDAVNNASSKSSSAASVAAALAHAAHERLEALTPLELWEQIIARPLWMVHEQRKQATDEAATAQAAAAAQVDADAEALGVAVAADAASTQRSSSVFGAKVVIVLDALDESESNGNNPLLKVLSSLCSSSSSPQSPSLPPWVGLLVSSRPEAHILRGLAGGASTKKNNNLLVQCKATTISLDELDGDTDAEDAKKKKSKKKQQQQQLEEQKQPEAAVAADQSAENQKDLEPGAAAVSSSPDASAVAADDDKVVPGSDLRLFFSAVARVFMSASSSPEDRERVVHALLRKSRGMFLYGRLILEQQGLELGLLTMPDESERAKAVDASGVPPLTLEDIEAFPLGLNNFYLELLRRATVEKKKKATKSSGCVETTSPWQLLRPVLSAVVVAFSPLSLAQMASLIDAQGGVADVLTRSDKVRSVLHVKPAAGMSAAAASNIPSSTLQLFHRSFRDWLVSPERLEDDEESEFFIDERAAHGDIVRAGWADMLLAPEPRSSGPGEDAPVVLLRVADAVLPSRLHPASDAAAGTTSATASASDFPSSLLCYSISFLPSHALAALALSDASLSQVPGQAHLGPPKLDRTSHGPLHVLIKLLTHLQYLHMRTSSEQALSLMSGGNNQKQPLPLAPSSTAGALSKEFTAALDMLERLRAQHRRSLIAVAAKEPSDSDKKLETTLQRGMRTLRAFQAFYRSELPHFHPPELPAPVPSKNSMISPAKQHYQLQLARYAATLHVIYMYAASYPLGHPVRTQVDSASFQAWLTQWRSLLAGGEVTPDAQAAGKGPLQRGWVRWTDHPTLLSPCVGVLNDVGAVTSLACAAPAVSSSAASSSVFSSSSSSSPLFAVGQQGGTFSVFELNTLQPVYRDRTGMQVGFDTRLRPSAAQNGGAAAAAADADGDEDDDSGNAAAEPPFFVVSAWAPSYHVLDVGESNAGNEWSSRLNFTAAAMSGGRGGFGGGGGGFGGGFGSGGGGFRPHGVVPAQYAMAPIHDRAVVLQYGEASETFLANNSAIHPLGGGRNGGGSERVVAAVFAHSGNELFVSVQGALEVRMYNCDEWNAGRPPMVTTSLWAGQTNTHASALAVSRGTGTGASGGGMDDFVARGGSCGSVGLWRRRRIKHEKGWEDSEFDYTEFDSLGAQARFDVQPGSIQAIAVSDDGARVLAARGTSVLLFDAASKQCVAHFTGHMDTVTALAFSPGPDARLGLSGGGGVDRSVRLWELPLQPDTQLVPLPAAAAAAAASEAVDADSQALVPKPERQPQYTLFERAVWALAFQRDVQAQNENSVAQVGTNYLLRNVSAGVQRFRLGSPAASAVESANDPSSSKLVASLPHVPRLVLLSPLDSDVVFAADSCETMALYLIKTGEVVRNLEAPSALKEEEEEDADGEGEEDGAGSITTSATVSTGESWGPSSLTSGCFTPCGRLLVLAGYNRALMGSFSVWDVRSGRRVAKLRVPRQQLAKERESHRHDSFSYDITLCEHENQNSSSGGGERSYWIAAVAPNDIVTQWRLVVPPTDDFTATPPKIEQMWQQRVDVLSSHATVHGLRYFQSRSSATAASASFAPLLLLADSASVVSIRSSLNGALLHCFSAAASGARTDPSDPGLMGLELLGINQGNAEEDVQLVTVSASEGASVWQVGSLLRQLCSAAAAGQVTPAPSTGAGLVADETGVLRPPLRSLSSPPPLQASLRCTSQMCTRMAVSAEGDHIAIGALDGSVFIFNRAIASNNNSVEAAASAAAPAATKSLPTRPRQWRGLFDFRPAQRAQLNGLVAQLDCLQ